MIKKIKILIFVNILFCVSCIPLNKDKLAGTYEYTGAISKGIFVLSENSFKYSYEAPLLYQESEGTWKIHNNHLYLKSNDEYKSDYIEVDETASEKTYIKIVDNDDIGLGGVTVRLNDASNFLSDINGEIDLNTMANKISKIEIFYIGLSDKENVYAVKNVSSNKFIIKIIQKHETKLFFDNKIKINPNKITYGKQKYYRVKN